MADKELDEEARALAEYGQKTEDTISLMKFELSGDPPKDLIDSFWRSVKTAYKLGVIKGRKDNLG